MIKHMLRTAFALLMVCGTQAFGQSVLTARAGLLHYAEGNVLLDDKIAEVDLATFPSMKAGSVLKTTEGRAEVLLNPGVFLRLGENTTIKLVDGRLDDARVELIEGTAVLESDWETVQQADAVTI